MIIKSYQKKVSIWATADEPLPDVRLLNGQPIGWSEHETTGKHFAILAACQLGHLVFKTDDKTGELLIFSARKTVTKVSAKATAPTKTKIIKAPKKVTAPAAETPLLDNEVDW